MILQTLESIFNVDGKDMIVLPFKSYLLNLMDLHPEDRQHVDQIPGYLNYLDACTKQGFGYTVLDKGRPIVCLVLYHNGLELLSYGSYQIEN